MWLKGKKCAVFLALSWLLPLSGCGETSSSQGQQSALTAENSLGLTANCPPKAVYGLIGAKYAKLGGESGWLGCALTDELSTPNNLGRYNHFVGGSIYYKWGAAEAYEVHGYIRDKWAAMGWERSNLGFPVTDELGTPDGRGRFSHFEGGSIYWRARTNEAFAVYGKIRDKWAQLGWERGNLGFPITDERPLPNNVGRYSDFERGRIVFYWGRAEAEVVTQRPQPPASNLNSRVLEFARSRIGQQVGRGECWDLAYAALNAAGAHLPGVDGYGITVFGAVVPTAIPGDIIQFEGVRFVYPNGSWNNMAHHTAIVEYVNGTVIGLIHQNSNGVRSGTRGTIDLKAKTQGVLTIYRPQPR